MNKTIAVCDGCGATLETGIIIRLDICSTWRSCGEHEDPLVRNLVEVTGNPRSMVKCREVHFCNPECAKTFLTTALLETHPIKDPTLSGNEDDAQRYSLLAQSVYFPTGFDQRLVPGEVTP